MDAVRCAATRLSRAHVTYVWKYIYSKVPNKRPGSLIFFKAKFHPGRALLETGRLFFFGKNYTLVVYLSQVVK